MMRINITNLFLKYVPFIKNECNVFKEAAMYPMEILSKTYLKMS